jgi:DNA-directed RNA polymerase subunit delta
MSLLNKYEADELKEMSMVQIAFMTLSEKKDAMSFSDLVAKIADKKGMSDSEVEKRIAQFYTDLNIEGRFINLGDNNWGLREWYPVEKQQDEELTLSVTAAAKKKRKELEDDEDDHDDLLDDDLLLDDEADEFDDEDFKDEIDDLADDEDLDDEDDEL